MEASQSPAADLVAVTPHDSTMISDGAATRGLYVGTTGNVTVLTQNGQTVTLTAVPAGALLPIRVKRVNSTLTTASNIVAFF